MIPTKDTCLELLLRYGFPERKRRHVILVSQLSLFIGQQWNQSILPEKGAVVEKVDLKLLEASALLHDLDKGIKGAGKSHPKKGVSILRQEGYPKVAAVVAKHSLPAILDSSLSPKKGEEKILFLADKMVRDKIMTVEERFHYWREEHIPALTGILTKTYPHVKALENEIFKQIAKSPVILIQEFKNRQEIRAHP